jgi:hypothetical protein
MEITRDVLDVLDMRLAAQDARIERLENRMNVFMEKTMEFMTSYPLNNATAGIAAVSNRRQRDSAAEALPAEQEAPHYEDNRAKMNSSESKSGTNSVTKSYDSNNFNNRDNFTPRKQNDKTLVPYYNPYQGKLNNLSTTSYIDNYNDDNDEYINDNYDSGDDIYDLCEVYGNRNENIEVLNMGSNLTNNLSLIDRNDSDFPCHAEGTSLYTSNSSQNPPQILRRDTSLRDIDIVEEEQVSVFSIDNANNTSHSNIYRGGLYIPKSPVSEMQSSRDSRGNKIAVISIRNLQFVSLIKVYDPGKYCTSICIHFPYFNSTIKIALLL